MRSVTLTRPEPGLPRRPARAERGHSAAELLLALTAVALLALAALPTYSAHRDQHRRQLAEQRIVELAAAIQGVWDREHAYPDSLDTLRFGDLTDPWGHPYVYYNIERNGPGGARKHHAQTPVNSDFDLYSRGADGLSTPQVTQRDSLDDVLRATNGAFVGLAADL